MKLISTAQAKIESSDDYYISFVPISASCELFKKKVDTKRLSDPSYELSIYFDFGFFEKDIPKNDVEIKESTWSCSKELGDRLYDGSRGGTYEITKKGNTYSIKKYCK